MKWLEWLTVNWTLTLAVAVPILSTALVKWFEFYGTDRPGARRAIRFLLSLLACLPARGGVAKGARVMLGGLEIAPPLISWSGPDHTKIKSRAGSVLERVGLIFIVLLVGCGGMRSTLVTASQAVTEVRTTVIGKVCDQVKLGCTVAPCKALETCHKAEKGIAIAAKLWLVNARELNKLIED